LLCMIHKQRSFFLDHSRLWKFCSLLLGAWARN
jgi:hypothetical protein